MAIFKVVISTVQVTTGIVEANSKEEITAEPSLWAGIDAREPPKDPRAVLVAATITIS